MRPLKECVEVCLNRYLLSDGLVNFQDLLPLGIAPVSQDSDQVVGICTEGLKLHSHETLRVCMEVIKTNNDIFQMHLLFVKLVFSVCV